jgi:GcrA cell cycle regulator
MSQPTWTEERIDRLKALHREGVSFGDISRDPVIRKGGHTRNACIGKAMRLGLQSRGGSQGVAATEASRINRPKNPPKVIQRSAKPGADDVAPRPLPAPLPKLRVVETDAVHRTILDPLFRGCRWPVSGEGADTMFCCATQVPKKPYCLAHEAIGHVAMKPGRPRTGNELMRSVRRYT